MRPRIPDASRGDHVVATGRGGERSSPRFARLLPAALWIGSLVATFQLGSWRGASRPAAVLAPEPGGAPEPAAEPARLPPAFGEGDVRRWIIEAVRAEAEAGRVLAAGSGSPPSVSASGAPESGAASGAGAEPDFDPVLAGVTFDRGEHLLQAARQRGTWTLDDAMQLRGMMPQLPEAQRHALSDALFAALENGRLRSERSGPPL